MSWWNPFKSNSLQTQNAQSQLNNVAIGTSTTAGIATSAAGSVYMNTTNGSIYTNQLPTVSGLAGQTITIGSGTYTFPQNGTYTIGTAGAAGGLVFVAPLTQQEQDELTRLQEEWNNEKKQLKISEFKKLPSELRQFVITNLSWQEAVANINTKSPDKNARLQELEGRGSAGSLQWVNGNGNLYVGNGGSYFGQYTAMTTIALPEGLSIDDLKNAHTEQTIEEEMLDEESI